MSLAWVVGSLFALMLIIAFVCEKRSERRQRERDFYRGIEVDPTRPTHTISGNRIGS